MKKSKPNTRVGPSNADSDNEDDDGDFDEDVETMNLLLEQQESVEENKTLNASYELYLEVVYVSKSNFF